MQFTYKSEDTKEFNKAFLKFQESIMNDAKAAIEMTVGYANNKYVKIEDLYKLILPFLAKVSMTVDQPKLTIDGHVYTMTVVTHVESDQFKRSYDYMYPADNFIDLDFIIKESTQQKKITAFQATGTIQQMKGSIETYVCRRALCHMLCLPLKESEDFDAIVPESEVQNPETGEISNGNDLISDEQNKLLWARSGRDANVTKIVCNTFGVFTTKYLKQKDFGQALEVTAKIVAELKNKES